MLDSFLYVLLGIVSAALAIWGGFVSTKSLPENEPKWKHYWGFAVLGIAAVILTLAIGVRNYYTQKETSNHEDQLRQLLEKASGDLAETKTQLKTTNESLFQNRLAQENMRGQITALEASTTSGFNGLGGAMLRAQSKPQGSAGIYAALSNKELRERILTFVLGLRQTVTNSQNAINQAEVQYMQESQVSKTPASSAAQMQKVQAIYNSAMQGYIFRDKSEAILLRHEAMARVHLPASAPPNSFWGQFPISEGAYETPVNFFDIEAIATELEMMAKSLPDDAAKRR